MDCLKNLSRLHNVLLTLILSIVPLHSFAGSENLYIQHNLVSDGFVPADHVDVNLINPWGLAFGTTTPAWVADNGSGVSTIYNGLGSPLPLKVTIPAAPKVGGKGTPTGVIFNNTTGWVVTKNGKSASAFFIFVTEDGTISGWSPAVDSTNAIIAVDNSTLGAVYKGLTRGADGKNALLYVTNFNSGKIEVYDSSFHPVTLSGHFIDPHLPAGYAPFGIQNINGDIYVTYGKQDATKHDAVNGKGLGIVNVFDASGNFLKRVATGGVLNAPWAVALTPAGFGKFSNRLVIGNFGDGKINVFDLATCHFQGHIHGSNGKSLTIDGLWSLAFGNGFNNQRTNVLYFTAGPADETHGIYGSITPAT